MVRSSSAMRNSARAKARAAGSGFAAPSGASGGGPSGGTGGGLVHPGFLPRLRFNPATPSARQTLRQS
ncbi:MAG: hypothetical protein ACKVP5_14685 [Aestuariivirga sp.]